MPHLAGHPLPRPALLRQTTLDEKDNDTDFFNVLGGKGPIAETGEDDDQFEKKKAAQLKLYRVPPIERARRVRPATPLTDANRRRGIVRFRAIHPPWPRPTPPTPHASHRSRTRLAP